MQIDYADFKRRLIETEPAYSHFKEGIIRGMYDEQHPLSLVPEEKHSGVCFWLALSDESKGPFTLLQTREMWRGGAINQKTPYRNAEEEDWRYLGDVLELMEPKLAQPYNPLEPRIARIDLHLGKIWGLILFFFILWLIDVALWIVSTFFHAVANTPSLPTP